MGEFDPVSWETIEAVSGPPAAAVERYADALSDAARGKPPYEAVKTIHDALAEEVDADERTVPGLADVFIVAYLLEKEGVIAPSDDDLEPEYRPLLERRPSGERLEKLFWEDERTLWWIGVVVGVHPSLVTYWLYEEDVPLMERNLSAESMRRVREYRSEGE